MLTRSYPKDQRVRLSDRVQNSFVVFVFSLKHLLIGIETVAARCRDSLADLFRACLIEWITFLPAPVDALCSALDKLNHIPWLPPGNLPDLGKISELVRESCSRDTESHHDQEFNESRCAKDNSLRVFHLLIQLGDEAVGAGAGHSGG